MEPLVDLPCLTQPPPELLDCNHSKAHNIKKSGNEHDANWCVKNALAKCTVNENPLLFGPLSAYIEHGIGVVLRVTTELNALDGIKKH